MKTLTAFASAAIILANSSFVYAGEGHGHDNNANIPAKHVVQTDRNHGHQNMPMKPGQMKGHMMPNQKGMMGMHTVMQAQMQTRMDKMQTDLTAINNETNTEKKQAMINAHYKEMKGMMSMMQERHKMMQSNQRHM